MGMGPLVLIWDGSAVIWCTNTRSGEVGRRAISQPEMIQEVLKALRNQVGAGLSVFVGEWGSSATVMPAGMFQDNGSVESIKPWFELHHGSIGSGHALQIHHLEDMPGTPCLAIDGSHAWMSAAESVFPQCRKIPMVRALVHDAIQWNRRKQIEGWIIRVDVRNHGAVFVATHGESLMWVHHLGEGLTADDCLYVMVNAVHRSGLGVEDCQVIWTGLPELVDGWGRFFQVNAMLSEHGGGSETWRPLLQSLAECA